MARHWITMRTVLGFLTIAAGVAAAAACSSGDAKLPSTVGEPSAASATPTGKADATNTKYPEAISRIVEPVLAASDEWTATFDRQAKIDKSTLSKDDAIGYGREALAIATKLHAAAAEATTAIRDVLPPPECANTHLKLLESLQLIERGALDAKTYYEVALRPAKPDESRMESANELLARADRSKVDAEITGRRDGCGLFSS